MLLGLLIQLVVAALLGALFESVTRRVFRLPSDYGMPALTGLVFGLLIWLAAYFAVPALIPQLMVVAIHCLWHDHRPSAWRAAAAALRFN